MTTQIVHGNKEVGLDQLKKHIKDTIDSDYGSPELLSLLESLKSSATHWKILANTIIKIRNIENIGAIVQSYKETKLLGCQSGHELYCICR